MKGITRIWIIISLTVLALSLAFTVYARRAVAQSAARTGSAPAAQTDKADAGGAPAAQATPTTPAVTSTDEALAEALQNAVKSNQLTVLGFLINDVEINRIVYSNDQRTALLWLAQRDPVTGDVVGTEPALAVASNPQGVLAKSADWQIAFEFGPSASFDINSLPPELVTDDLRMRFAVIRQAVSTAAAPHTGYKLPYSTALRIRLTGSIGHFLVYNSCSEEYCRYAYDFWNPDPGNRMFPLLASKGGVVQAFRESCQNGDESCTNYLVLRDDSTVPTTYQLYFHLAYDSIPDDYVRGTYIQQGQYIGNVDDTGYSSDHHLHFHVYEVPTSYSAYNWGRSVRILFADVPQNGGEPRTCAETVNYPSYGTECSVGPDGVKLTADDNFYQSGNVGAFPPNGGLDTPAPWTTLTERTFTVSGPASDNLGIARVQVLLNTDGTWRSVTDAGYANGRYSATLDMCALGIANGPFSLAVRIWDIEGNWVSQYTGMRQLFKNVSCGGGTAVVPACSPAAGEVALYSEPFYLGNCKKFTAGKYQASALAPVGDNQVQSIQVGTGVRAVLFDRNDDLNLAVPQGRLETFGVQDANLADNRIGARQASALWVLGSADIANPGLLETYLTFPGHRVDSDGNANTAPNPPNPTSNDSLVLSWTGGRGATFFTGKLEKNGVPVKSISEQKAQSWSVGSLAPGQYLWSIVACNGLTSCAGSLTNTSTLNFTVDPASLPTAGGVSTPTPVFNFDGGPSDWSASGLWRWGDANRLQPDLSTTVTKAWIFNNGASIADAAFRGGDLTSPPIQIAADGNYFLRFKFFSGVEGPMYAHQTFAGSFWDQRRIQVSVNGGPFNDVSGGLLVDDTQNTAAYWPDAALALGNYSARQTIRVRFQFAAVDGTLNDVYGWAIDDVSITNVPFDPGCKDNNDTPAAATPLTLGAAVNNSICPMGDIDFFSFSASGGTPIRIDLDAKSLNSLNPLDSFLTLLDDSGQDVAAANDDEDPTRGEPQYRDSLIETILPKTGTYTVRVKAWNHPGGGGPDHPYRLTVSQNTANVPRPTISLRKPEDPARLPIIPFIVEVNASDPNGSGVKQVDFYWHSNDWENGSWVKFATDSNGSDGWWAIYNPSGDMTGSAFYMLATNNAGGSNGVLVTGLAPDLTTPVSELTPLPATTNSTAIQLTWSASDIQNDIERFDIQYKYNNAAAWTDWPVKPAGGARSAWFVGQPGSYQFRMRAVDSKGNQEAYPTNAETATTIASACVNDASEPANNSLNGAVRLAIGESREFVFCQNDTDWVSFEAQQGQELMLRFISIRGGAAVQMQLYNASGAATILQGQAAGVGQPLVYRWIAPAAGVYTVEMRSVDPAVYGSDARYQVYAGPGKWYFMPLVGR